MGKKCKTCGLDNPADASNCARCGAFLDRKEGQSLECGLCGKANSVSAEICEFCGAHLLKPSPESPPSAVKVPSGEPEPATNPTTNPTIILLSPEIITNPAPTPPAHVPRLPLPPDEKPKRRRVKSLFEPIILGGIYIGLIALVVWIVMVLAGMV